MIHVTRQKESRAHAVCHIRGPLSSRVTASTRPGTHDRRIPLVTDPAGA
ncbi:hypothetical protein [Caulifigura coniformis]|nr:hypothetical protein [Caulifigura coniformis]